MFKCYQNRIGVVLGTRPEAIKMAPVIRQLQLSFNESSILKPIVYLSGQHQQLLHESLELFNINSDFDLCVMKNNQQLADLSAQMVTGFDKLFLETAPTTILVHGDTTTAYAAALAAFYRNIPVGHVEAGLRSGVPDSPFPEEFNRRAIDSIASLFFTPTGEAVINLIKEGVPAYKIFHTGNTVIDALLYVVSNRKIESEEKLKLVWKEYRRIVANYRIVLVTSHRRETTSGTGLTSICQALLDLVEMHPDVAIVFPVHPNPNVSGVVNRILKDKPRVFLLPPLDYFAFSFLMNVCTLILTDSGGIQEEAPALKKPVFVLRDNCERPEVIRSGGGKLVGTARHEIISTVSRVLNNQVDYNSMANSGSPYGDGLASKRIVDCLLNYYTTYQLEAS